MRVPHSVSSTVSCAPRVFDRPHRSNRRLAQKITAGKVMDIMEYFSGGQSKNVPISLSLVINSTAKYRR